MLATPAGVPCVVAFRNARSPRVRRAGSGHDSARRSRVEGDAVLTTDARQLLPVRHAVATRAGPKRAMEWVNSRTGGWSGRYGEGSEVERCGRAKRAGHGARGWRTEVRLRGPAGALRGTSCDYTRPTTFRRL